MKKNEKLYLYINKHIHNCKLFEKQKKPGVKTTPGLPLKYEQSFIN